MSLARLLRARLSESQICELREAFARIVDVAPTFRPVTPGGSPMSVAITNAGSLGWTSTQRDGYHYTTTHPTTGLPWPPIPELLRELWREHTCATIEPECCLVNLYRAGSKLGLHVDRDEPAAAIRAKMDGSAPELLRLTAQYVAQARNGCMFQLAHSDLQAAVLQAKCVVRDRSDFIQPVKLRGDSDGLVVAADSPSTHMFYSTRLDATARGDLAAAACWVTFKLRYLLDCVEQVDAEHVELGIPHAIADPLVLRGAGRIVVILPIRMDAHERAPDYDAWRVHADAEEARERQREEAEARHAARIAAGQAGTWP